MASLNVLGALSGIGRGTLKGLQYHREREQQEEEKERRERNDKIRILQNTLPHMDENEARILLGRDTTLGDDDKSALMGIVGVGRSKRKTSLDPVFEQAERLKNAGGNPEEIYKELDRIITTSQNTDQTKENARRWVKSTLGITTDAVGDYTYEDFSREWKATDPNDRQGLKRLAENIGHPEWLGYVGERAPGKTTTQGRTPEEIIDDQSRIIGRRIRDIDARIEPIDKLIANFGSDHEKYPEWVKKKQALMDQRDFLRDRESELGEPDAKPVKNLKKWLTRPMPKKTFYDKTKKERNTSPSSLRGKAIDYLVNAGYEPTEERIQTVIKEGLVK